MGDLLQVNVVNSAIHLEGGLLVILLERHMVVNWKNGRRDYQDPPIIC